MHRWLVTFVTNWPDDLVWETTIEAPRLWDVPDALKTYYPDALIKGVAWILPEEEVAGIIPEEKVA